MSGEAEEQTEAPSGEETASPQVEQAAPEAQSESVTRSRGATAPRASAASGRSARSKKGTLSPNSGSSDEAPLAGAYHVALPAFEGPLDLLLHLIQQHELDIKDIPIAFISEKYLEYIMVMHELNIDLASEYLVMAATLAHIKSKMLLPKPPVDQEDEAADDLDPRGELVRRLLEYQKYKHAAEQLGQNSVLGRDVFVRGAPAPSVDGSAPLAQVSVFKLFDAFQRLLTKAKQTAEHLIDVDRISISERIIQLTDLLRGRARTRFDALFDADSTRSDLVVTFLALLEMTRLRMMQVIQEAPLEPIFVELTLAEEHEEILNQDLGGEDPLAALARGDLDAAPLNAAALVTAAPSSESGAAPVESEAAGGEEPSRASDPTPAPKETPVPEDAIPGESTPERS